MRRPAGPNLPRPRRTERAASARPAEPLCKAAKPPSYLSYSSYWSYRGIREEVHLASNQYGPGKMANFPCSAKTPVRAKSDGPTPVALRANRPLIAPFRPSSSRLVIFSGTPSVARKGAPAFSVSSESPVALPLGTSQTCQGAGAIGGLEVWLSSALFRRASWHVADVPGVQGELLPAGAWGSAQRPTPFQFSFPFPFLFLINRRAPARPKSASICEICVSHSGVLPAVAGP